MVNATNLYFLFLHPWGVTKRTGRCNRAFPQGKYVIMKIYSELCKLAIWSKVFIISV